MRREPLAEVAEKHTVAMPFVHAAVARLDATARQRVLEAAGIAPGLLAAPDARVPAGAYSALWLAVARELDDEFFGLDSRRMKVGSFALLCQAVLGCQDLERGVKRMLRGFSVFLDDIAGSLQVDGGEAVVVIRNRIRTEAARRFADETLLVLLHGLMCWLVGRRIPLAQVAFAWPRPAHAREYTSMFSEHVLFDAATTTMRFDAGLLALPVVQTPATLQAFLRTAPQSVFLKYRNDDSWTARLRRRLRGSVAGAEAWPVFEELARELDTTPTTLRRRLEAEGTSHQGIKDQLRSDLAIDALCNGSESIDEIAAQLGFLDSSAFHRAFKRWNGLQPGEYRRRQGAAR